MRGFALVARAVENGLVRSRTKIVNRVMPFGDASLSAHGCRSLLGANRCSQVIRALASVIAFVLVASCVAGGKAGSPTPSEGSPSPAGPTETRASLNEPFDLDFGATRHIDELGLAISFTKLISDSRCPIGVTCVWDGNAEIELAVTSGGSLKQTLVFDTKSAPGHDINGLYIELVELHPWPNENDPKRVTDYRGVIRVSKLEASAEGGRRE